MSSSDLLTSEEDFHLTVMTGALNGGSEHGNEASMQAFPRVILKHLLPREVIDNNEDTYSIKPRKGR